MVDETKSNTEEAADTEPGAKDEQDDYRGWAMGSDPKAYDEPDDEEGDDEDSEDDGSEDDAGSDGEDDAKQDSLDLEDRKEGPKTEAKQGQQAKQPPQQQQQSPQYTEQDYLDGVKKVDEKLESLAKKYEDGEIDFGEYRKQERAMLEDRDALKQAATHSAAERKRNEDDWQRAANAYVSKKENEWFQPGKPLSGLLFDAVAQKVRSGQATGKTYDQLLSETGDEVRSGLRSMLGMDAAMPNKIASKAIDELKARREKRLAASASTPAKAGKPAESPNPNEGWAARW